MCGRVIQASGPLHVAIVDGLDVRDSRLTNVPPRYNAAPSQELLVIRQNHQTGERSLDFLKCGLIPYWCSDPKGGRKPINAKAETVARLPMFRDAYARRRCIVPVDGFFEWKAIRGQRAKQPFAIAMKDGSPFGIAGLWENWKSLETARRSSCRATRSSSASPLLPKPGSDHAPPVLEKPNDCHNWSTTPKGATGPDGTRAVSARVSRPPDPYSDRRSARVNQQLPLLAPREQCQDLAFVDFGSRDYRIGHGNATMPSGKPLCHFPACGPTDSASTHPRGSPVDPYGTRQALPRIALLVVVIGDG
jgi:putative SOS response-associated peptidase YedK